MTHHLRRSLPLLIALGAIAPACLSRPLETIEPKRTSTVSETLPQSKVDKIDILLAIDDSGSMADKQDIMAVAVPSLVDALVNPACVGPNGELVMKPSGPLEECPDGSRRDFEPVLDIHIGVISSSLGAKNGYSAGCADDDAMLLNRTESGEQPTYDDKGFLVWQPEAEPTTGRYADSALLNGDLQKMVIGVSDQGCGYEHSLESWYRFLIDPNPYTSIEKGADSRNVLIGTDDDLLAQRAAFLRPDSLVAIVMLSDENDCSFRADGIGYATAASTTNGITELKARAECAGNPDDPCCTPCGYAPESCPDDPTCEDAIPDENLLINLTCFEQKRRYGMDLLYPTDRYVKGLTQRQIEDRDGNIVDNPLLVSADGTFRGTDRVFLTGIVGVPWQLIARDAQDLGKGYQSAAELDQSNTWQKIVGNPAEHVPPTDPHMVESIQPRDGLPGPNASPDSDPMHGHEYTVLTAPTANYRPRGDLQHACTFELPDSFECQGGSCDCNALEEVNSPLCQNPDGSYGTTQYRAKAYPSLRQLSVLQQIGDQAIVASICPAEVIDEGARDFGYNPAIEGLVARLREELKDPCLPRDYRPSADGQVACIVLEARQLPDGESCGCDHAQGRSPVTPNHQPAVDDALESPLTQASGVDCFCEIDQLAGAELDVCQESLEEEPTVGSDPVNGWCYVDPLVGNEALVSHCQPTERRTLRFVGEGKPVNDSLMFITCHESH